MEILKTDDYKKFKLHLQNRQINYKKVQKLAESMKEKNLLPYYPIVVDKNFVILDGQHRYEAAKLAKVTISYLISHDGYDIKDVPESNNFQSHWRLEDYINYWAKEGKQSYIKLLELSKKYKIGPSTLADLQKSSQKDVDAIKLGCWEFVSCNQIVELIQHCKAIGIEYGFHFWNKRSFLRAMNHIMKITGYNKLRMSQKIMSNRKLLVKCPDAVDYIKLLQDIYNKNTHEPLRFL